MLFNTDLICLCQMNIHAVIPDKLKLEDLLPSKSDVPKMKAYLPFIRLMVECLVSVVWDTSQGPDACTVDLASTTRKTLCLA